MVTCTKAADDKVVTMSTDAGVDGGGSRPRTLLEDVNTYLTCELCRGYYIDATTIVECLHSFCRSCIVKHLQTKKYCPVCGMMINAAKPNIKPDKALQDIVYKLIPGLFQREMERRRQFYSSRPGPAASTTPEQRGEDTERIIFSPEDVISFSLEYAELTDAESVSSRSSESGNEAPTALQQTRRYLQCPAVVNISHLKKFISMKFDIDCTQFCIDILYKRVPLLDYYTLMDIAYIYNWKRNEPMRFFYQIIDYSAIRSRFGLFDTNRKGSHYRDRKKSPTLAEDTNIGSPAAPLIDHSSEGTSGTNSPMPDDCNNSKFNQDKSGLLEKNIFQSKFIDIANNSLKTDLFSKLTQEVVDVEKSQFLNSFELTAKNNSSSPSKSEKEPSVSSANKFNKDTEKSPKKNTNSPQKIDDGMQKRKISCSSESVDSKKQKFDQPQPSRQIEYVPAWSAHQIQSKLTTTLKKNDVIQNKPSPSLASNSPVVQNLKPVHLVQKPLIPNTLDQIKNSAKPAGQPESQKRTYPSSQNAVSPKCKSTNDNICSASQGIVTQSSHMKLLAQNEGKILHQKTSDLAKINLKKLPDLKPNIPNSSFHQNKPQSLMNRGIRTDLLANNSDPISDPDRSKILTQVKRSLIVQSPSEKSQMSGDPLKSLFDSCKINIPSSLSITLTDQKLDSRNESNNGNDANNSCNKNSPHNGSASFNAMKSPTPAVQNSIEILKLPDVDQTKLGRTEVSNIASMPQPTIAQDSPTPTTAKGPVPSLKPISDSKMGKQSTFSKPSPTFHQIFIQSLQSQQPDKAKVQKTKAPVPKLMPANPKPLGETSRNEPPQSNVKTQSENKSTPIPKSDSVLDLSTPSQLGPHQTKLLETMQSIANLAKKQNFSPKPTTTPTSISAFPQTTNKPLTNTPAPLRIPAQSIQNKSKTGSPSSPIGGSTFQSSKVLFRPGLNPTPNSATSSNQLCQLASPAQSSPIAQTRSPSVSPKLVIAEEKQTPSGTDGSQSNQISSSQISSTNTNKIDSSSQPLPGQSKPHKILKQLPPSTKLTNIRMPGSCGKVPPSSHAVVPGGDILQLRSLAPQMLAQQQVLQQALQARQHSVMQSIGHMLPSPADWINKFNQARHIENLYKSLSNAQQAQNEFNGKDNNKN